MADKRRQSRSPLAVDRDLVDALYRISRLAGDREDAREALELIIDEIMALLPAASATIDLINPDTKLLEIEVFRGLPDHSKILQLQLGQGVTGWVALHGEPLVVNDVTKDPRYIPVKESICSEMAVPMREQGEVIGVVNVDSEQPEAFNENHLKALTLLTNEATRVMSRLWRLQQLQMRAQQLQGLLAAGRRLVGVLAPDQLAQLLAEEGRRLARSRRCALFLLDETEENLVLKALSGTPAEELLEESLPLSDSALGTAVRRHRQVEVLDMRKTEEHHFVDLAQAEGLVSVLASPLIHEDRVLGVLNVYTTIQHRFSNDEKNIQAVLASLGALAVQNARLYARVFATEDNLRRSEKLTTLGLLSAEIAHEIRNPLTVIKLLFEAMDLEFPPEDPRQRDAKVIAEKLDQLEAIVTRVLQFGKSREGLHAHYDLGDVLADTVYLVRLKLAQSRIILKFDRPSQPLPVEASKSQLQQAFLNLIINATQAMPDGGKLRIDVSCEEEQGEPWVMIDFTDTGSGIPEAIRERVFDTFLTGHAQGTGLGLSIVKRIVVSHHGRVEVTESSAAGTTIRVTLPLRKR